MEIKDLFQTLILQLPVIMIDLNFVSFLVLTLSYLPPLQVGVNSFLRYFEIIEYKVDLVPKQDWVSFYNAMHVV